MKRNINIFTVDCIRPNSQKKPVLRIRSSIIINASFASYSSEILIEIFKSNSFFQAPLEEANFRKFLLDVVNC